MGITNIIINLLKKFRYTRIHVCERFGQKDYLSHFGRHCDNCHQVMMESESIVCIWPDDSWCYEDELEKFGRHTSDDYEIVTVPGTSSTF